MSKPKTYVVQKRICDYLRSRYAPRPNKRGGV